MKLWITIVCLLLTSMSNISYAQHQSLNAGIDLLQDALDSIGFERADLGYRPKDFWTRFPTTIPYKLKSFDDLYAEPLKMFDYAVSFGGPVLRYLEPARLDSAVDNLYKLVYSLGVERKTGGFRSYGANLADNPGGPTPLVDAVEKLFIAGGDVDWPDIKKGLMKDTENLPLPVRTSVAGLVENIHDAIQWRDIGLRNIDYKTKHEVFYIRDLATTQSDGTKYYPEIDDAASSVDFESICYAALKVAAAVEKVENELKPYAEKIPQDFMLDIPTPLGRIVITGPGNDNIDGQYMLLGLDFGGDDTYTGPAAATSHPDHPVSVLLDLDGNDSYQNETEAPCFGAGILGIGLLYDAGGSDRYEGGVFAQGAGFLGVGILFDKKGIDDYKAEISSQGAAYFGIGLCIDAEGDDSYYIFAEGQGFGGVGGGVGCLADYSGNDKYTAEPSPEIYDRADYHSDYKVNANNAQGCGSGRRGDMTDGHSWAGGLGVLVDAYGDDVYLSGNWSLGCGYWFSTGILYDGHGNDQYRSVYFTQASGAHFCNAALVDEAGDDAHILYETAGAALAFGWDFANSLYVDRAGNDMYEADMISYGLAQIRSFAFFFEMGGTDSYTYAPDQQGFGAATFGELYAKPDELRTYDYYTRSAGIFIDASGTDNYLLKVDDDISAADKYRDNAVWFTPGKDDPNFGHNNYGIGLDREGGRVPELEIFD